MNFMPFGQLKSFLKILIEVQYDTDIFDQKTKASGFRRRLHCILMVFAAGISFSGALFEIE